MADVPVIGAKYIIDITDIAKKTAEIPGLTRAALTTAQREGIKLIVEAERQAIQQAQRMAAANAAATAGANATAAATTRVAVSSGQAKAAMFSLQQQMLDIGQGLATGQNPMTVLAQQGPQVATAIQQAGGATVMFKAALASLAPYAAVLGPIAVAVGAIAIAYGVLSKQLDEAEAAQRRESAAATDAQKKHELLTAALRDNHDAYLIATNQTTRQAVAQRDAVDKAGKFYREDIEATTVALRKATAERDALGKKVGSYNPLAGPVNRGGQADAVRAYQDASSEVGRLSGRLAALASQQAVATAEAFTGNQETEKGTKVHKAAADTLAEEARAYRELLALMDEDSRLNGVARSSLEALRDAQHQAAESMMSDTERVVDARNDEIAAQLAIYQAGVAAAGDNDAEVLDLTNQFWATKIDIATAANMKLAQMEIDARKERADAERKDQEKERKVLEKAEKDRQRYAVQAIQSAGAMFSAGSQAFRGIYDADVAYASKLQAELEQGSARMTAAQRVHLRQRIDAERAAAAEAWNITQGLALASAIANTASGVAAAIDDAPWPANAVPIAEAGLVGGAQIATVAGATLSMARGGFDGIPSTLHPREAVLTPTGRREFGDRNISDANAGVRRRGRRTEVLVAKNGHRAFNDFIGQHWERGGKLRELVEEDRIPGHRRDR